MKDSSARIVANAVRDCERGAELRDKADHRASKNVERANREFAIADKKVARNHAKGYEKTRWN